MHRAKGKRILVAEKDDATRELILMRLHSRHHKIFEASTSSQVMRFLEREVLDLILLSSEMEPVNGKMLIQIIRSRSHLMAVPVIMITEEHKLTELMLGHEKGFDDFLVKPFSPLVLQLRVNLNIAKTMERVEANALTHLPGNHAIEKIVLKKIQAGEKFSVLYIDINNFKAFNDHYSFQKGDEAILQTARLLVTASHAVAGTGSVSSAISAGMISSWCFRQTLEEVFARQFIDDFDRIIPTYYSKKDRDAGFIRVENRRGKMENFPIYVLLRLPDVPIFTAIMRVFVRLPRTRRRSKHSSNASRGAIIFRTVVRPRSRNWMRPFTFWSRR